MKIALFDDDIVIMQRAAKLAKEKAAEKMVVVAEDIESLPSPIIQSAQAYWLMGWTWEEIDAVLIDEGYSADEVANAIKETKLYAKEMLEKGPFGAFKTGQLIKLINGYTGKLVATNGEEIVLSIDGERLIVEKDQIDTAASKKLTKAFVLTHTATKMWRTAVDPDYAMPDAPNVWEESVELPRNLKTKELKQAPPGLGEVVPDIGEAEQVDKAVAKIINNVEGLRAMRAEVEAQKKKVMESIKPLTKQIKELSADEKLELQNLFQVLGELDEGTDAIDQVIFGDYAEQLVAFRQRIIEKEKPLGPIEELNALRQILSDNHPRIAKKVFAALEEFMDAYTTIDRTLEQTLYKFPYRQKPRKKGQLVEKIKQFFTGLWDKVVSTVDGLFAETLPLASETADALQEFTATASKQVRAAMLDNWASEMMRR